MFVCLPEFIYFIAASNKYNVKGELILYYILKLENFLSLLESKT